jgi:hypothetical protein
MNPVMQLKALGLEVPKVDRGAIPADGNDAHADER